MNLSETIGKMRAALVDMDGTILDTMPEWRACNTDYLEARGIALSPEQRLQVVSCSTGSLLFEYIRDELGVEVDVPTFRTLQRDRMMEAYRKVPRVKPGAREFLAGMRRRGVKVVLATATWSTHTLVALNGTGLLPFFDAICCGEVMDCGKSRVEYYDRVSALIGVPKDQCVLFDDALYALRGASTAGILGSVAVADPTNEIFRDEFAALAVATVTRLDEVL